MLLFVSHQLNINKSMIITCYDQCFHSSSVQLISVSSVVVRVSVSHNTHTSLLSCPVLLTMFQLTLQFQQLTQHTAPSTSMIVSLSLGCKLTGLSPHDSLAVLLSHTQHLLLHLFIGLSLLQQHCSSLTGLHLNTVLTYYHLILSESNTTSTD